MSSRHPGGVNTLFGDGSVRFMKNSINAMTWVGLGSIKGGEVISADSYWSRRRRAPAATTALPTRPRKDRKPSGSVLPLAEMIDRHRPGPSRAT